MKCAICRNGQTVQGTITIVMERSGTTVIIKDVPAEVCDNCGEEYISSDINKRLLEKAEKAIERGVDIELLRFAA
ncbi:MAG: type II toxin-antitoxin system MqsA family antitoxin [Chitinivibrionales bacterium]|nr:type II toxin-antitoxin system MqsA family antitoxin [Chitinivibrionales bacterium]